MVSDTIKITKRDVLAILWSYVGAFIGIFIFIFLELYGDSKFLEIFVDLSFGLVNVIGVGFLWFFIMSCYSGWFKPEIKR